MFCDEPTDGLLLLIVFENKDGGFFFFKREGRGLFTQVGKILFLKMRTIWGGVLSNWEKNVLWKRIEINTLWDY